MSVTATVKNAIKSEQQRFEGVSLVKIYILRLVFLLAFLFVGLDSWKAIFTHEGNWDPMTAMAVSVWAAYTTLLFFGILRPLRFLSLAAFLIFYKVIWLASVALPLWMTNQLAGSDAEGMAQGFAWVILPIAVMPWKYFVKQLF